MQSLIEDIKQCTICKEHLVLGPRPVVSAHPESKIVIIGQAPGTKVHAFGLEHKGYNCKLPLIRTA